MPVLIGNGAITKSAMLVGAVLLAYNAFSQLVWSFSELAAMAVSWRSVSGLFKAAARPSLNGALVETPSATGAPTVLEADRVTFRYRSQGPPVLEDCSVAVRPGDRVLLEGPSGGGKTTLASILSGLRQPESGLLLSGGLDKATLGESGWSDRVVSVPQFHENHILTESLAFNVLLGQTWPPPASDLRRADDVCRRLGLGDLLDRMPNGLMQMVGEGGWQLSHGEKSRIFMARALLQNSDLLILDESFGALDPENMNLCLEYTLEQANALMVIAHP
jgi:ATP-binding cassette subfamily B protein